MKIILKTAALLLVGVLNSAGAADFRYSFTIDHYQTGAVLIAGTFSGNLSGNLITDLSNISAYANGVALEGSGSLYSASRVDYGYGWTRDAVVSIDGTQNNFFFANSDFAGGRYDATNYVASIYTNYSKQFIEASGISRSDRATIPSLWRVSPVPEPTTSALLIMGIGVAFAAQRAGRMRTRINR